MTTTKASILAILDENRARLGFGRDQAFVPTPNVRNPHMLEEADAFSHHLGNFERAVRDYHRRVQGFLRGLLPLLDANLPRVWLSVDESSGLAEPVRASISHGHPSRVGGDYDTEALHRHLDRLDRGIQEEILLPLRRWQEGLTVAKERMRSLDRLRREVDEQRRKSEKKFSRAEAKLRRAYLGAGYGSSSSSDEDEDAIVPRGRLLEDYHRLALHTERQLRALLESYEDQERLVWEQLSGLVTDAAWLESYAAAAMLKVKEAFQGVALALGPSKQPLPAYRGGAYQVAAGAAAAQARYGDVGDHTGLIAQMSPRAVQLAQGRAPRAPHVLPYQPLKAKKGLATPLLVAAAAPPGSRQRALAREDVPDVEMGASGLPLHALPAPVRERAFREVEASLSVPPSSTSAGSSRMATAAALPPALAPPAPPPHHHLERAPVPYRTPALETPSPGAAASRTPVSPATAVGPAEPLSAGMAPPARQARLPAEPAAAAAGAAAGGAGLGVGESVPAAAASGGVGGGGPVPFGHLAEQQEVPREQERAAQRAADRRDERLAAAAAPERVARIGGGFGGGGDSRGGSKAGSVGGGGGGVLDSLREAAVGLAGGERVGRGVEGASDDVLDSYAAPAKAAVEEPVGVVGEKLEGRGGVGMAAPAEGYLGGSGGGMNGVAAGKRAAGLEAELAGATAAATPMAANVHPPNIAAESGMMGPSSSSSHGSRPPTPGGSITDAIKAEIQRSSPQLSPSAAAAAAAATLPSGSPGRHLRPAADDAAATGGGDGAAGLSNVSSFPLGAGSTGNEEGEEFVDACSEAASSRASSLMNEPHSTEQAAAAAAGAPWSPGQPDVAGLTKQQQQLQMRDVQGLVQ